MLGERNTVIVGLAILALCLLLGVWLVFDFKRGIDSESAYFDPAIAMSNRVLQAFAARVGGTFRPGPTTWKGYSHGWGGLPNDVETDISGGSHVSFRVDDQELDAHTSVDRPNHNLVLVPRIVVTFGPARRWRSHAQWNSLNGNFGNASPPGAEEAYQRLAERSYRFTSGTGPVARTGYLDARGPLTRATYDASGKLGRVDFDVDFLLDLTDRACAFVRAATTE